MFVPLWDLNPVKRIQFPFVTTGLVIVNCLVYFFFQTAVSDGILVSLAVVPTELIQQGFLSQPVTTVPPELLKVPEGLTLITYMFLHGNFQHLLWNMVFLWVFGDNIEDAMGHVRFLFFYLLCGIFAGVAHAMMSPQSALPLVGASGAIAGVIAAYLMLHPNVRLWVLVLFRLPLRVSAGFAIVVWIALQIYSIYAGVQDNTAWWAHIGGLVAGAVLVLFMRKPGVPLFDRATGLAPPTQTPDPAE